MRARLPPWQRVHNCFCGKTAPLFLLAGDDPCKPHGQWWPEGDEHQVKDEYRQEGEDPSGHGPQAITGDGTRDDQAYAHGWGQHADGQIDHYNGPQVEGAKANVRAMVIAKSNRFISLSPQE